MSAPVLDPDLLKAFVAVADSRSFTRAATQLNRTQSAVSMQIKRLEERIGVELFNRTKASVDLSSAGEGLLGYARRILTLNDEAIGKLRERKVEGVAVMTFGIEEPLLEQLAKRKVPMVFIDVAPERPGISLLKIDYRHGMLQGVQHLVALGHRDIAFITGPAKLHSAQSRTAAFSRSLKECGITPNPAWLLEGDHTLEGGIAATEQLLSAKPMPTAVMCSNDMTAIGVLHKLYRAGLRVPDDLSVIGFDNIHISEVTIPPLTTIQMSRYELARAAFTALCAQVEDPEGAHQREYNISTDLVVRESTGLPRKAVTRLRRSKA